MITEEPLFRSTHEALVFAFNYMGQQSPKTPMTRLFKSNPGENDPPVGLRQSKGLYGLDAAAQAGMILAEVCRLPDDQHNVIVARYYRAKYECMCCESEVPRKEWKAAIDALSHCVELEGLHRKVRLDMVIKAICGGKLDVDNICKVYSMGRSTTFQQFSNVKTKFRKLERLAIINLDNAFMDKGVLVA